jgi:hypothetical protein
MDPYLERYWGDVHTRLCTYSADLLQKYLPAGLVARLEERTIVESDVPKDRVIFPDVRVSDYRRDQGGTATAVPPRSAPIILEVPDEPETERQIQIRDTANASRVITVIEFASPANKISTLGRQQFKRKQLELVFGGISLVEVDLLRAGRSNLRAPLSKIEPDRRGLYYASVTRGWETTRCEVYAIKISDPLPVVEVPLRETDNDAPLDLQAVLDLIYRNGAYGQVLDYTKPPDPPLNDTDAQWARDWLLARL